MSKQIVRVNGRGNAWPVFVGSKHPFYRMTSVDLANASYSIISYAGNESTPEDIEWSVLIDAGNHTVPYIIQHENRIPEAIFITHPHLDHTIGIDWIAQSHHYTVDRKVLYPVYCTQQTFQIILMTYPHLKKIIRHRELIPGETKRVEEVDHLHVTSYPVYHGNGGLGASMLLFDYEENNEQTSVLFTGDMICPLLCRDDYALLSRAKTVYIDTNNRFPYPASNHGSFTPYSNSGEMSIYLSEWLSKISLPDLLYPHKNTEQGIITDPYLQSFIHQQQDINDIPCSVLQFAGITDISNVHLVHYSGREDMEIYQEKILKDTELLEWAQKEAQKRGYDKLKINVPKAGDCFEL